MILILVSRVDRKFTHMAIVLDPRDNVTILGAVTLEDVIDELLEHDEPDTQALVSTTALVPLHLGHYDFENS